MIAAAALATAALAGAPVALLDAPNADSVAVAGNEVVVARHGPRGRVLVDAIAVPGGATRRLLNAAGPGKGWSASSEVTASAQRVAVRVFASRSGLGGPDRLQWRFYTGPVAGPLTLEYRRSQRGFLPIQAAVDGERVLLAESKLSQFESRLRLFVPGAAPRVLPWGPVVSPIALAGTHVAYAGSTQSGDDAVVNRIFVSNVETGAREGAIADRQANSVDVTAAGAVVADGDHGLVTVAPGVPPSVLPGSANLFQPVFAGASVAALQRLRRGAVRPALLDPGAARPRAVGVPSFEITTLAADEHGVAWMGNGCVLYAPVDAAAPAEPPAGPCPRAELALDKVDNTLHGRTVRLGFACVAAPADGCRVTLILRRRGAVVGRKTFHLKAGTAGPVSATIDRRAAQDIRRAVNGPKGFTFLGVSWRVRDGRSTDPRGGIIIDRVS